MRREQVFWGWGEPGAGPVLSESAIGLLRTALGIGGEVVARPVDLAAVRLGEPSLPGGLRERLADVSPLRDDREARVLRCRGKSYLDLLAQRAGDCRAAPAAVVAPRTHEEVLAILRLCSDAGVPVVPFGGGTSVVGGLELAGAVSLDLGGLDRVLAVDPRSLTAIFEPGLRLPEGLGERIHAGPGDRVLGGHRRGDGRCDEDHAAGQDLAGYLKTKQGHG
jgi:alkyldihydroxyacetonephosphate synthase